MTCSRGAGGLIRDPLAPRHSQVVAWRGPRDLSGRMAMWPASDTIARVGCGEGALNQQLIGCIAGVRYNASLRLHRPVSGWHLEMRPGHGLDLWRTPPPAHGTTWPRCPCNRLEAAPERSGGLTAAGAFRGAASPHPAAWGRGVASAGHRDEAADTIPMTGWSWCRGNAAAAGVGTAYDAQRETRPAPTFLADG